MIHVRCYSNFLDDRLDSPDMYQHSATHMSMYGNHSYMAAATMQHDANARIISYVIMFHGFRLQLAAWCRQSCQSDFNAAVCRCNDPALTQPSSYHLAAQNTLNNTLKFNTRSVSCS
jgi:hypothetical protein